MAHLYPDIDNILKLRVKPTQGEMFLLSKLQSMLNDDFEIFFQPFLDGDRPDVIIVRKNYGIIIIEVKDWNLKNYYIDQNNKWHVETKKIHSIISSPMAQSFTYKYNFFELHLPLLGIKSVINKNFYKIITPCVYFHNAKKFEIEGLYIDNIMILTKKMKQLYDEYRYTPDKREFNRKYNALKKKKNKFERDQNMSLSRDNIEVKIKRIIQKMSINKLFSDDIYEDFKRRLAPCTWIKEQSINIELSDEQKILYKSKNEMRKFRGASGCGKTTLVALRALDALSQGKKVLILCYNITLRNLIRDRLNDARHILNKTYVDIHRIEISNYHNFFISQLNNYNI